MTDDRWPRVKALFQAAVERPAAERDAFLSAATGDDDALRREVESLLASDASDVSFLDQLPVASESVEADPLAAPLASMDHTRSHNVLTAGLRVGPYEIVAPLGAGAMGEVYRACDTTLNRDVALKVLPELFALDPDRLARFTREAQMLATLNHPNIARYLRPRGGEPLRTRLRTKLERSGAGVGAGRWADARRPHRTRADSAGRSVDHRASDWPTRWKRRTRRASFIATSSRRTSRSPAMGWSRCSTSGWRRCGTVPRRPTSQGHRG